MTFILDQVGDILAVAGTFSVSLCRVVVAQHGDARNALSSSPAAASSAPLASLHCIGSISLQTNVLAIALLYTPQRDEAVPAHLTSSSPPSSPSACPAIVCVGTRSGFTALFSSSSSSSSSSSGSGSDTFCTGNGLSIFYDHTSFGPVAAFALPPFSAATAVAGPAGVMVVGFYDGSVSGSAVHLVAAAAAAMTAMPLCCLFCISVVLRR